MKADLFHAFPTCEIQQCTEVRVDCVNSARTDQSKQMQSATLLLLYLSACTREGRIGVEAPVGDGRRDPYQILHHDASGAKIEVADFAVAHLSGGKAHTET